MSFTATISPVRPLIIPVFIPYSGCPFRCAFCDQTAVTGTPHSEIEHIDTIVERYLSWSKPRKRTEISFYGGTFTLLPRSLMEQAAQTAHRHIDAGIVDSLRCSTRPDAINEETAQWLADHHFKTVELGAQSLSDSLLADMRRGHSADDTLKAVNILKSKGISVVLQFISGYPGSTETACQTTTEMLAKAAPDAIRIYPFVPFENTTVFKEIADGKRHLLDAQTVINRSAFLFIAAQKQGIPVIRIGLPTGNFTSPYPGNLAQIVISRALDILKEQGEQHFTLPKSWEHAVRISSLQQDDSVTVIYL